MLILLLGIVVGFNFTPLPFLLAQAGVPVERIASVGSIVNLPGVLVFFWAPLVDVKLRRLTWLGLATLATALSVCIYFPADRRLAPESHDGAYPGGRRGGFPHPGSLRRADATRKFRGRTPWILPSSSC